MKFPRWGARLRLRLRSSCTRLVTGRLYSDLKQCQKSPIWGKNGENCSIKKIARTKMETFLGCTRQNLFRTVDKSWKNRTVWSQQSFKKNEKMPHFDHFPRPGEIDPYVTIHHSYSTSALIQRRSIFRSSNSTARGLHGREHLALLGDSVVVEVFCSKTLNHPSPILTLVNAWDLSWDRLQIL